MGLRTLLPGSGCAMSHSVSGGVTAGAVGPVTASSLRDGFLTEHRGAMQGGTGSQYEDPGRLKEDSQALLLPQQPA